jgi:predicted amidophosphoribosyltransferase
VLIDSFKISWYPFANKVEGTMGVECPKCKTENTSDSEFCKKCATPLSSLI